MPGKRKKMNPDNQENNYNQLGNAILKFRGKVRSLPAIVRIPTAILALAGTLYIASEISQPNPDPEADKVKQFDDERPSPNMGEKQTAITDRPAIPDMSALFNRDASY